MFEEFDHPVAGRVRQPRHPAQFLGTPATLQTVSPMLGEHTDEILVELGRGEDVEHLRAEGVVF
jgi:crotonobetainyl-CoA:carnitine CoA-transferase CaiB-like acyl-CoA transferase